MASSPNLGLSRRSPRPSRERPAECPTTPTPSRTRTVATTCSSTTRASTPSGRPSSTSPRAGASPLRTTRARPAWTTSRRTGRTCARTPSSRRCGNTRTGPEARQSHAVRRRRAGHDHRSPGRLVSTPTLVDLFAPEWLADPYPFYRRLREDHPVYHDDVLRRWVVSRHGDIAVLSTDDRLTEDRVTAFQARLTPETRELMRPLAGLLTNMILFATGPRHAALRNMAKAGFSRRVVADL